MTDKRDYRIIPSLFIDLFLFYYQASQIWHRKTARMPQTVPVQPEKNVNTGAAVTRRMKVIVFIPEDFEGFIADY
ncbi:MAG: hypothetical protein JXQ82_09600 [Methanomicrobiaceae archaeon]|nr:hypothetical protein [Methanomicrobiaceae archaeon]